MDVFQTVSGYITKMVSAGDGQAGSNATKMKILLLDSETVSCMDSRTPFITDVCLRSPLSPLLPHNLPFSIMAST